MGVLGRPVGPGAVGDRHALGPATGGGADSALGGLSVQPTVLTGITPASTVIREEVFGPVLAAPACTDEDESVRLADDTPYGLAAAVWTKDVHRAHRVAAPGTPSPSAEPAGGRLKAKPRSVRDKDFWFRNGPWPGQVRVKPLPTTRVCPVT